MKVIETVRKGVWKGIILKALAADNAWHEAYLAGASFDLTVGDGRIEIGPMRMSGYCLGAYSHLCGHMFEPMPELTAKELARAYKKSARKAA